MKKIGEVSEVHGFLQKLADNFPEISHIFNIIIGLIYPSHKKEKDYCVSLLITEGNFSKAHTLEICIKDKIIENFYYRWIYDNNSIIIKSHKEEFNIYVSGNKFAFLEQSL